MHISPQTVSRTGRDNQLDLKLSPGQHNQQVVQEIVFTLVSLPGYDIQASLTQRYAQTVGHLFLTVKTGKMRAGDSLDVQLPRLDAQTPFVPPSMKQGSEGFGSCF